MYILCKYNIVYQCTKSKTFVSNPSKDEMMVPHIFNTLYATKQYFQCDRE